MSKISSTMDIGKRAMMNSKSALQTVGHNIANKDTEGYSRQRVETQTNTPVSEGNLRFGMGAKSVAVTRVNNPQLERQIGHEKSEMGFLQGQNDGLSRVEQVYNEQMVDGLNSSIAKFFNSFRELTNSPESMPARKLVTETAAFMAKDFNKTHNTLLEIRKDLDQQVATHVIEINQMSKEISTLNEKIQMVELNGTPANDERDRRDTLIKNLGEKINIRWAEGKDGMVTITAGNSAILVSGRESAELAVAATPESGDKGEGNFDVLYKGTNPDNPVVLTSQFKGGAIGGLLKVRDEFIHDLLGGLDKMAYEIGNRVNDAHMQGFNAYNETNLFFFKPLAGEKQASLLMSIDRDVFEDPAKVAAAGLPKSPGDNSVANKISDLQYKKFLNNDSATIDEFYNSVVGKVGVVAGRIENETKTQQNILNQLTNIRESISGVSLDEETTKMIEFQKAFDASARLIKTADEMLETVINLKR